MNLHILSLPIPYKFRICCLQTKSFLLFILLSSWFRLGPVSWKILITELSSTELYISVITVNCYWKGFQSMYGISITDIHINRVLWVIWLNKSQETRLYLEIFGQNLSNSYVKVIQNVAKILLAMQWTVMTNPCCEQIRKKKSNIMTDVKK